MKKKNGFTLIELLAIIVILAIIAVITVPIILNIIENAKMGAAQDSAYGYKDAINKYYLGQLTTDPSYSIPNGTYTIGELGEQTEGKKPDSELSWFKIKENEITKGCLQFDEYKVNITNGEVKDAVKGQCESSVYVPLTGEVLDNIASYDTMEIVYYNPVSGTINCTDYVSNNSIPGFDGVVEGENSTKTEDDQTSCLKWYKYSTNIDGSINMILDHNTEVGKQYYTSSDNSHGPDGLMQYLEFEWQEVPTRNDSYTAYVDNNGTKTAKFTNLTDTDNAVNYSEKKARLITAQEIAEITGAASTTSPGISWNEQKKPAGWFYLDSKANDNSTKRTADNPSNYSWLFENLKDCEQNGCVNEYQDIANGNDGYWTSSPYAGRPDCAWYMRNSGTLNFNYVNGTNYGVRPVITIPVN